MKSAILKNLNFAIRLNYAILMILLGSRSTCNLFCNANFQNYSISTNVPGFSYSIVYGFIPPDACWYPIGVGITKFLVKKVSYYPNNQMVELMQIIPHYTLCAKLTLQPGQRYNYSFDIGIHPNVINSTVYVYLNNTKIGTFYKYKATQVNLTTVNGSFTASSVDSRFCVNSSQSRSGITFDSVSTFVDNFLMIKVINVSNTSQPANTTNNSNISNHFNISSNFTSNNNYSDQSSSSNPSTFANQSSSSNTFEITQNSSLNSSVSNQSNQPIQQQFCLKYNLQLQSKIYDEESKVVLTSILPIQLPIALFISDHAIVIIEGQLQKNVNIVRNAQNKLEISIILTKPVNIKNLAFSLGSGFIRQGGMCMEIVFQILHTSVIFSPLSENQKKTIQFAERATSKTIGYLFDSYNQVRFFFVSYFVSNFISFFNIIILYNFLFIQLQPSFSYSILEKMSGVYFNSNQSLLQIIMSLLSKINAQFSTDFNELADTINKQKIPQKQSAYIWFSTFGISYNFLKNSFTLFFSLGMLSFKILIYTVFRKIIRFFYSNVLAKNINIYQLVIMQFICSSSAVSISALSSFTKTGNEHFLQKINDLCQYFIFFTVFHLPFIYWLTAMRQSIHKQINFKSIQYSLHILIPCLVVMRNRMSFFAVITLILFALTVCYFRYICHFTILKRIYLGLILFTLVVHHICFSFLFCICYTSSQTQIKLNFYEKISGVIVIFTVLFGSIVQLFDILVDVYFHVYKLIKFCCKNCHQKFQNIKTTNNEAQRSNTTIMIKVEHLKIEKKKIKQISKNKNYTFSFNKQTQFKLKAKKYNFGSLVATASQFSK